MKVLWTCNFILPAIALQLGLEPTNKEGWVQGLAEQTLADQKNNQIQFGIAFPVPDSLLDQREDFFEREFTVNGAVVVGYGFREQTDMPHRQDPALEGRLRKILEAFRPQVVHCFGTEYPHALALCRACAQKDHLLISIQGLCTRIAKAYEANLPENVVKRFTFRDLLKQDNIALQKKKFRLRGEAEREAIQLAGNVGGRTIWDRSNAMEWNPAVRYFEMKETLRRDFYEGKWEKDACEPHSIFLSQGDYPIKGLHYVLLALPAIREAYPDVKVYVAGNNVTAYGTWKEKLKISSYGKYLRDLMKRFDLTQRVVFLGKLGSSEMKKRYLKSSLFVCPSAMENSPNSLGEAMLLGMPCVTSDVGGILSMFTDGEDGIAYQGWREETSRENGEAERIAGNLAAAVLKMWSDPEKEKEYCENARIHALRNHERARNYERTMEIYAKIAEEGSEWKP